MIASGLLNEIVKTPVVASYLMLSWRSPAPMLLPDGLIKVTLCAAVDCCAPDAITITTAVPVSVQHG